MAKLLPQTEKMSAEAFEQAYLGKRAELVRGEVREYMPAGGRHGEITANIGYEIAQHVRRFNLGKVFAAETGFVLNTPEGESVRAPDVAFVRKERLPEPMPEGFLRLAPDLVVEVASPNDSYQDLRLKIEDWLQAGVALVWVVDPKRRCIEVYTSDGSVQVLSGSDVLTGAPVLPEFRLTVASLFE